ncbi:MAG: hypothetical protein OXG88_00590 [Gammaproteobacteria bacterium]|nr:hypothetical protein [Gammaproteobacteria bacterium]
MKIEMKKRFRALATVASVLLLGTGTIYAVDCGTAYNTCIKAIGQKYTNCSADVIALHLLIEAAAQNYTATVANIPADDPERANKIEKAKIRMQQKIAGYEEEIKELAHTCESNYEKDMKECEDDLNSCVDP